MNEILILNDSIANFTASSLLIPLRPTKASGSANGRTLRVQGSTCTFQGLVDALGAARRVKYETQYLDPTEVKEKEEQARLAGDEGAEMQCSIRPLIASRFGVADGEGKGLDNAIFDFKPETLEETFKRVYG
jgi:hypothetical protein